MELGCCCQLGSQPGGPYEAYAPPADHTIRARATDPTVPRLGGGARGVEWLRQTAGVDFGDDPVGSLRACLPGLDRPAVQGPAGNRQCLRGQGGIRVHQHATVAGEPAAGRSTAAYLWLELGAAGAP